MRTIRTKQGQIFHIEDQEIALGYLPVTNPQSSKVFWGKLLHENAVTPDILASFQHLEHAVLRTIDDIQITENGPLILFNPIKEKSLDQVKPATLSAKAVLHTFSDLVEMGSFLSERQLWIREFALPLIFLKKDGGCSVLGYESARLIHHQSLGDIPEIADTRYTAPEVLAGESYSEKSDVYRLGALFYHFLTGEIPRPQQTILPVTRRLRRLKNRWNHILAAMLMAAPHQRPDWQGVQDEVQAIAKSSHVALPAKFTWLCPEDPVVKKYLTKSKTYMPCKAKVFALCQFEGKEKRQRAKAFIRTAQSRNDLIYELYATRTESLDYCFMNQLYSQLRQTADSVYTDLPWPKSLTAFSEWDDPKTVYRNWRRHFMPWIRDILTLHHQGMLILIRDFGDMDQGSVGIIIRALKFIKDLPLQIVCIGRSFAAPAFRQLHAQNLVPVEYMQPSPIRTESLGEIVRTDQKTMAHLSKVLDAVGADETLWLAATKEHHSSYLQDHLSGVWGHLTHEERSILKVVAASVRPLSSEDLKKAFNIVNAEFHLNDLGRFGILIPTGEGFLFAQKVWESYVKDALSNVDRKHIFQILLQHEVALDPPDAVQAAYLADQLDSPEAGKHLDSIKTDVFDNFDLETLNRMDMLFQSGRSPSFAIFSIWSRLVKGEPLSPKESGIAPASDLGKANRALAKGQQNRAIVHYRRISGSPKANKALKCFALMRLAEVGESMRDGLTVSKAARSFRRLVPENLHPSTRNIWWTRISIAATATSKRTLWLDEKMADLPPPLQAWHRANAAWHRGRMKDARDAMEDALPYLENLNDPYLLGTAYKLQGNIFFRYNQAEQAIDSYHKALKCFQKIACEHAVDYIYFNLATSENLAGRFAESESRFKPILEKAIEQDDCVTQAQITYSLMVCALFRNQMQAFEKRFFLLRKLAKRCPTPEEQIKGLALWLHTSMCRNKEDIQEKIDALETALTRWDPFPLLRNEVNVSMRFAALALGKVVPPPVKPYPKLTAWRHQLLDMITGVTQPNFQQLLDAIGTGFFKAYHLILVEKLAATDWIPPSWRTEKLATLYQKQIIEKGGQYSSFLRNSFQHLKGIGNVPRSLWESALQRFEQLPVLDASPEILIESLLKGMNAALPFERWGTASLSQNRTTISIPGGAVEASQALADFLARKDVAKPRSPMITIIYDETTNRTDRYLLIPIASKPGLPDLLWFCQPAHKNLSGSNLEPLFRFYAKLFELSFGQIKPSQTIAPDITSIHAPKALENFGLIGRSGGLQRVLEKIHRVGPSELNVYIWGESGTGKELAARALHYASDRRDKPFRVINCSQFQNNLVESELFGHVRGAFTGAAGDRMGALEIANGGTLFIDEIGDINPKIQSMLLRVIQEGEFSRIGDTRIRKVDIRIITATNKDLNVEIDAGRFRADLFFRIVEEQIDMPALRDRFEDIKLLADHFLKKHAPHRKVTWSHDFVDNLREYHWPGNIRELESYIRKVLLNAPEVENMTSAESLPFLRPKRKKRLNELSLQEFEQRNRIGLLRERLDQYGGNRTRTAGSLGITRQQLTNLISKYHIHS